jgi:hypothetical protein
MLAAARWQANVRWFVRSPVVRDHDVQLREDGASRQQQKRWYRRGTGPPVCRAPSPLHVHSAAQQDHPLSIITRLGDGFIIDPVHPGELRGIELTRHSEGADGVAARSTIRDRNQTASDLELRYDNGKHDCFGEWRGRNIAWNPDSAASSILACRRLGPTDEPQFFGGRSNIHEG